MVEAAWISRVVKAPVKAALDPRRRHAARFLSPGGFHFFKGGVDAKGS